MAFVARLGALTEELIEVIVTQPSPARLRTLKDSSLQSLRHHNYLRTNQFDVDGKLIGLEERFRVLDRDGLADALRENLDALPKVSNKFTPEVLHFLLEVADQPVQKSRLEDLELLRQPEEDPGRNLKWAEIAREDNWATDRDIWRRVDFRDDSSGDELVDDVSEALERSEGTSLSSVEARYRSQPTDLIVNSQDTSTLDQVRESQSWRLASFETPLETGDKTAISELQAVREVMFMIRGLNNDLFNEDYRPSAKFKLQHASWRSFQVLLSTWGESGRSIYVLRRFTKKDQQIALLQVFQDAVEKRLRTLDGQIAAVEAQLVDIKQDTIVSLIKVAERLKPHIQPLCSLSQVVHQLETENYPHPFRYLELLYESVSIARLGGNDPLYEFLATIFFECFQVYLRPIREWMQSGELLAKDKAFFITEVQSRLPLSQVWDGQFALRRTKDGVLHAPKFLQPAVEKIFMTGKSIVILKHLGKYDTNDVSGNTTSESPFNFEKLVASDVGNFTPFSEIFGTGFEEWMQSKHHSASAKLRGVLFECCGLWSILSDLQHIYLMVDGSRFDEFAHALFNNLDSLNSRWHDRFLLTQSFQDAFETVADVHRITVSSTGATDQGVANSRKSVRLGLAAVALEYRMSWPIRIVVTEESVLQYQAVFTLLLQIKRSSYILRKQRIVTKDLSALTSEQAVYFGLRSKLLWFLDSVKSYVSNLVVAPLIAQLAQDMQRSEDVDSMAGIHSIFAKRIRDSVCLGSKLEPIRESMLEVMDLAIRLEDAHRVEVERQADESQELFRLSVTTPPSKHPGRRVGRYKDIAQEEDESFLENQDKSTLAPPTMLYGETLFEIRTQFDRHLRFICGGLRGAARASKDFAASKWDMLADVLEVGLNQSSQTPW